MKWFNSHLLFNINQELMSVCSTERDMFGQIESFVIDQSDMNKNPQKQNIKINQYHEEKPQSINDILPVEIHPNQDNFRILKSAIEIAFPDFDFSYASPDHFVCINSPEEARSSLSWALSSYFPSATDLCAQVWASLESEIQPALCDIYSYEPNCADAFSAMGAVWKMSYLFYNQKQRKVLHFHLREGGRAIESLSDDDELDIGYEFDDEGSRNWF
ncbi:putative repressor of rna polymerase iii transcription [Tritrichomonas foetus]|uniref:Repressor of rna polymerase iii transcription n=1 Tax=Tritrichomonas foetus TaxID=1144522 RepID=A0A1J4K1Y6_9EUKA|nr:putative repressor of rna polymerase iii transcription [Tritrichomonas foetus]|eukprot:OHT04970.1 putative repressor of rna polymerase iii transcription [Tritrichomonas foetus]